MIESTPSFTRKSANTLGNRKRGRGGLNPTLLREVLMRTTQQLSITLPNEMADLVRAKVATGEYATEREVIREGLRT
jgi:hypothetical protein